jgi:hypothetical protein
MGHNETKISKPKAAELQQLQYLCSSPGITRIIHSTKIRWAGHVVKWEIRVLHVEYWWETQEERDYWKDKDVDGRIILNWILRR